MGSEPGHRGSFSVKQINFKILLIKKSLYWQWLTMPYGVCPSSDLFTFSHHILSHSLLFNHQPLAFPQTRRALLYLGVFALAFSLPGRLAPEMTTWLTPIPPPSLHSHVTSSVSLSCPAYCTPQPPHHPGPVFPSLCFSIFPCHLLTFKEPCDLLQPIYTRLPAPRGKSFLSVH